MARRVHGLHGTFATGESLHGGWSCCMHASRGIGYLGQPGRYEMPPTHDGRDDAVIEDAACMQPGSGESRILAKGMPPKKFIYILCIYTY
jgi:hypothetical protein